MSEDRIAAEAPNRSAPGLSAEDRQTLLGVARRTLESYLGSGDVPVWRTESPALLHPRASFVTLRRRGSGELRGCRGEYRPRRPLIESVAQMAIASAVDDSRFPPVTADELPEIQIEISALTPLRPIRPHEVEVGRHGLMIVKGPRAGLLLPTVPVEYGWDRDEFLKWLCRKAGLPDDAWRTDDVELYGFEAESWGEGEG